MPQLIHLRTSHLAISILFFLIWMTALPVKPVHGISLLDMVSAQIGQTNSLFNSLEYKYHSFENMPYWAAVLKKSSPETHHFTACARNKTRCETPQQQIWHKFIISTKGLSPHQMLKMVNRYFNKWPHRSDLDIYGVSEYWASLNEFMENSGDCEDYAIAKYFILLALGFQDSEMRIVAVTHSTRKAPEGRQLPEDRQKGHVVLAVYQKTDILILDNLADVILSHNDVQNYSPLYSVNQTTRWIHKPKAINQGTSASQDFKPAEQVQKELAG